MTELEKIIGYKFNNEELLKTALTHSSYANEHSDYFHCNERLEFLGDSVLGFITADYIYREFSHLPEGELTKKRAYAVCETTLAEFANEISLGTFLLLGNGEKHTGGDKRPSILSDAFEALIAAIYLDGGIENAKKFVLSFVSNAVKEKPQFKDYKTTLQEVIQQNPEEQLTYVVTGENGPDHDKCFTVEVHLNSNCIGKGTGRSKKQAEQNAAKEALELMGL